MNGIVYFNSPIGYIKIEESLGYIIALDFVESKGIENETEITKQCKKELGEYFNGERKAFSVPIKFVKGTEFQRKVWNELRKIPYGKTVTYKYIAEKIGNANASRAVGGANNKNPIAIIVPCHRVIGANGKMVGYAGGIDKKTYLLEIEKK